MPNPNRPAPGSKAGHQVRFAEAFRVWLRVAAYSFGGPAGQIAVMHRLLVEEKRWLSESRFLHALNYCMLLPGPEAQQLATYVGWLLHGWRGGLMAGTLFVLPGFISILALSVVYVQFRQAALVEALFFGLKAAVLAVVLEAVLRIGRRALRNWVMAAFAVAAFVAIHFFDVPFPAIVVAAATAGLIGGRVAPGYFAASGSTSVEAEDDDAVITDDVAARVRPSTPRLLGVILLWGGLWVVPLIALVNLLGRGEALVEIGIFFSKTALVTFGGAYAVLAYMAQEAVGSYGWLEPGEMLDGLGMAETTPGPLIQVVQFVGFMGAYRDPGGLSPLTSGVFGSLLTTWVTFVPCFLWIFAGAPYIEYLRGNSGLTSMLSTITAAVVGVVLNLAVWFSLNVLFGTVDEIRAGPLRLYVPDPSTLDPAALVIAGGSFVALFRFRLGMISTLAASAATGLLYHLVFRA